MAPDTPSSTPQLCPVCGTGPCKTGTGCAKPRAIDRDDRPTTIRMRAETSRRCFEDALEHFVDRYAPIDDPEERDRFQRDLMMLFHDAMRHQAGTFSLHIERTESTLDALSMHATGSLQAIYKEKP